MDTKQINSIHYNFSVFLVILVEYFIELITIQTNITFDNPLVIF